MQCAKYSAAGPVSIRARDLAVANEKAKISEVEKTALAFELRPPELHLRQNANLLPVLTLLNRDAMPSLSLFSESRMRSTMTP